MANRSEPCGLCAAPIELTLENPRRVCPSCGTVNLPTDTPPVPSVARRAWVHYVTEHRGIGRGTGKKWGWHAATLTLQLLTVFALAWNVGGGPRGDPTWATLFVMLASIYFLIFAAVATVLVYFVETGEQALAIDLSLPMLAGMGFIALNH